MNQIPYEWIRSSRKTTIIQIKEDGRILVRSPYATSQKQVEDFLIQKRDWILKQQQRMSKIRPFVVTEEIRRQGIQLAKQCIPDVAKHFSEVMGVSYNRITIREQKTRWGSCSSKGNLNFNWKLVLLPVELLEYVVVHELAHRKEMNHSPAFWKIVGEILPDYRERKQKLRQY